MTNTTARFDENAALFGNRFVTQEVPSREFPESGMPAGDAMRLVFQDLAIEACTTLDKKGGAHPAERKKIVTGSGH